VLILNNQRKKSMLDRSRFNFFANDDDDDDDDERWLRPQADKDQDEETDEVPLGDSPWPTPVEGDDLLEEIMHAVSDHAILSEPSVVATSLWVPHCYCYDIFENTPRLFAHSPTRRCGKTTYLKLLQKMVCRAVYTDDITGPALFARMHEGYIALLDELDSMPHGKDIRNAFNSGFERGGQTHRKYGTFNTFRPLAIAAIGGLHPTMIDRSITIRLKRKTDKETVKRVRFFDGTPIRRKCLRWVRDHRQALEAARPALPLGLNDRQADFWEPLLAVADVAGGGLSALARRAAVALSQGHEEIGLEEALLRDIREAFAQDATLFSAELVQRLTAKADARWSTEGLNEWRLADKLAGFEIQAKPIRKGGNVLRGYQRSMFADAWLRWC
jgi:hypothetical protein